MQVAIACNVSASQSAAEWLRIRPAILAVAAVMSHGSHAAPCTVLLTFQLRREMEDSSRRRSSSAVGRCVAEVLQHRANDPQHVFTVTASKARAPQQMKEVATIAHQAF
jgi:hypothetical protein